MFPARPCLIVCFGLFGGLAPWLHGQEEPAARVLMDRGRPVFQVTKVQPAGWTVDDGRKTFEEIFGQRFEFAGHDVRGLTPGPDGRWYFFCGDGGAAISRREGGTVRVPEEGAVLRCEVDGSHLEVFCRGLREPHGLAFDDLGNLFTADQGAGKGDDGRWLNLVEHGDYGWRVGWERSALGPARNPWIVEKEWAPRFEDQPAWMLPPVANVPVGAWALAHYPGTGFGPRYEDHFFAAYPEQCTLSSWRARAKGAEFWLEDQHEVLGKMAVQNMAFGPAGALYFEPPSLGAVLALSLIEASGNPVTEQVDRLLGEELKGFFPMELAQQLKNTDQRVRLVAEWRLAAQAEGETSLRTIALSPIGGPDPSIARVHAIWGLGLLARRTEAKSPGAGARILEPLVPLLEDDDPEVRAQAARVLGDLAVPAAFDGLIKAVRNPDERVSFFAAQALAKFARPETLSQLLLMIPEAADHEPNLRHAYVEALVALRDDAAIAQAARNESPAIRMVALLALRQTHRPEIAQFLQDTEPVLVREAIRAIHDENIAEALPAVAALSDKLPTVEALAVRVLNANFRLGQPANAQALAQVAAREDAPEALRIDALQLLARWAHPPEYDYVTGAVQTFPARDPVPARQALAEVQAKLSATASPALTEALDSAAKALRESP